LVHDRKEQRSATIALHGAEAARRAGAPTTQSIVAATSFYAEPGSVGFSGSELGSDAPPFYTRWGNPTVSLLEDRLALLEAGVGSVAFASGMAAISALFLQRLNAGDHLVVSDVCYAGTAELAHAILPRYGISSTPVDTSNIDAVIAAIRPGQTRLVHIETPANPILRLSDIEALAGIAHAAGAELSVDSTIATPIATQPLTLGADYVVHSLTKYICGHGDALGGAVIAKSAEALKDLRNEALIHHGGALSPFAAWLILRGLETLSARMRVHEANARTVADFLARHPAVERVFWPGLDNNEQIELARRQMQNFSGLLSFTVKDRGPLIAKRMAQDLETISYAVSLGKTKSLIFYIPTDDLLRSSFQMSATGAAKYRATAGEGVFRFSAGLEYAQDLIEDLGRALG